MKVPLIVLLSGISAFAQIPENQRTIGQLNCRFWNMQGSASRLDFVIGFGDAWNLFVQGTPQQKTYPFPDGTYGELAKGVTDVCGRPENSAIPIWTAISAFRDLASGESRESVEQMLTLARKMSSSSTLPAKK